MPSSKCCLDLFEADNAVLKGRLAQQLAVVDEDTVMAKQAALRVISLWGCCPCNSVKNIRMVWSSMTHCLEAHWKDVSNVAGTFTTPNLQIALSHHFRDIAPTCRMCP